MDDIETFPTSRLLDEVAVVQMLREGGELWDVQRRAYGETDRWVVRAYVSTADGVYTYNVPMAVLEQLIHDYTITPWGRRHTMSSKLRYVLSNQGG